MRIAIMGYSGSGKSTLARTLGQRCHIPVLHLDRVQFLADWQERELSEKEQIVTEFLDSEPDWIIDGNYTLLSFDRRLAEADQIILLLFGRLSCLYRAWRRYAVYRGRTRPDMTEGCEEKMDWEFIRWILWQGRRKQAKARYQRIQTLYPQKTVVLKNQRQLDAFLQAAGTAI